MKLLARGVCIILRVLQVYNRGAIENHCVRQRILLHTICIRSEGIILREVYVCALAHPKPMDMHYIVHA